MLNRFSKWGIMAVVLAGAQLAPTVAQATGAPVVDVGHIAMQINKFVKETSNWAKTIQNYQIVKDGLSVAQDARNITNQVKSLTDQVRSISQDALNLNRKIQDDLRKVASLKDMKLAQVPELMGTALDATTTKGGLLNHLGSYSLAQQFQRDLLAGSQQGYELASSRLDRYRLSGSTRQDYKTIQQQGHEQAFASLAVSDLLQQQRVQQAGEYKRIADEMTRQAIEAQASLRNEGRYAMTEGERMSRLQECANTLMQAQQMRQQADELLQAATQPTPARQAANLVIADRQFSASLAQVGRQFN
ncbi:hypothetical protein ACFPAF_16950 [Hymenobacter endophyticus]|uniref:P-type conjugative transfer protein TrbJ n=1 Tax=Hymenobacter endophyticus TaxID=3076335 RepID=A0ABU3TL47_9BACT|nr:hypothetical protein [Hymenobacter endophyticus]MDU0372093.1 hypothetical protein [Hymenobacter endophyticus]